MKEEILRDLDAALFGEHLLMQALRRSRAGQNLAEQRKEINAILRRVAGTADLALIIEVEIALLEEDQEHHANSTAMEKSLHTGLVEMQAVKRHLALVADKESYRLVDQLHNIPKTRKGSPSLPLDDARLALAGHQARLDNMDRSRLGEEEKEALDIRKAYTRRALGLYIDLQEAALA